jgi:hypothetical protein
MKWDWWFKLLVLYLNNISFANDLCGNFLREGGPASEVSSKKIT